MNRINVSKKMAAPSCNLSLIPLLMEVDINQGPTAALHSQQKM
ncbi:hypothetical protein DPEC_G00363650 [Dallia pectoralis]|nr:hypothetical protein DPEC_G00363650 [Dallia pectoralis]